MRQGKEKAIFGILILGRLKIREYSHQNRQMKKMKKIIKIENGKNRESDYKH